MSEFFLIAGAVIIGANIKQEFVWWWGLILIIGAVALRIASKNKNPG